MNETHRHRNGFPPARLAVLALLAACLGAILLGDSTLARVGAFVCAVILVALDIKGSMQSGTAQESLAPEAELPELEVPVEAAPAQPEELPAELVLPAAPQDAPAELLVPDAPEQLPAPAASTLDFTALSEALVNTDAPLAELKRFVGDIRTREAEGASPAPCGLERYAARMLEEAGLLAKDVELPPLAVVRPHPSHMVYLRCLDQRIPYLAKLRIIRLEAALNALRFASGSLPPDASMEEAYRLNQGLAHSIAAQAPALDEPLDLGEAGEWPDGEWTVRYGISQAIESLQLPYRLVARYRTNVADGNVAIEFDTTPADAFASSCYLDELGIVPTTGDMRQRESADYTLRLGLLLAANAFRCSERIKHVWVAGINETATNRNCYLSVDFDRWRFARIDLTDLDDLGEIYRSFAAVVRYEDGWLRPVRQGFHLEQERFCPSRRYLPVSLSSRHLKGHLAQSLGTDHVSGLSIEEADGRALVATAIMMRLTPDSESDATQKNVRTVMELAGDDPDPTVRSAAERVVRGLVAGTLDSDAFAIGEEFVRGDALTRANDRAKELLMRQKPAEARDALAPIVSAIDKLDTYTDSDTVVYRYFNSYVERALFNRMEEAAARATVMLVPDAYYEAHLLLSVTYLMEGDYERALSHSLRLVELAPLDARSHLHAARCYEMLERDDDAVTQLTTLLMCAHEPQGLGLAYYRMAFFQWKRGNIAAAHACYQCAMRYLPGAVPMMAMELSVLYLQNPDAIETDASEQDIEDALVEAGIPIAPTEKTSELFYDCARASLDAEIFPVARTFARVLAAFSGDDVIAGVIRSLEDEPDH